METDTPAHLYASIYIYIYIYIHILLTHTAVINSNES